MTANPTYTPELIAGARAMALELNPFADPDIGIEDFARAFAAGLEAMLPVSDAVIAAAEGAYDNKAFSPTLDRHFCQIPALTAAITAAIRYITGATDDLG